MSAKRKFRVGPVVHNREEVFQHDYFMIRQGNKWKTVHRAFVLSWQMQFCFNHIQRGYLRVAERLTNGEYYAGKTDDELIEMLVPDICERCDGVKTVIGSCDGRWCDETLQEWKDEPVK